MTRRKTVFSGVPRAANLLGVDERTIRKGLEKGEIPGRRFGRVWRIYEYWVAEQCNAGKGVALTESASPSKLGS